MHIYIYTYFCTWNCLRWKVSIMHSANLRNIGNTALFPRNQLHSNIIYHIFPIFGVHFMLISDLLKGSPKNVLKHSFSIDSPNGGCSIGKIKNNVFSTKYTYYIYIHVLITYICIHIAQGINKPGHSKNTGNFRDFFHSTDDQGAPCLCTAPCRRKSSF